MPPGFHTKGSALAQALAGVVAQANAGLGTQKTAGQIGLQSAIGTSSSNAQLVTIKSLTSEAQRDIAGAVMQGILTAAKGGPGGPGGKVESQMDRQKKSLDALDDTWKKMLQRGFETGKTAFHAPMKVAGGISGFVAAAAPGAMERFQLAVRDVAGVIGQRLAPVLEVITGIVRLFGDVLQTILPSGNEFADILKPVSALLVDLREALAPIAAVIHDVLLVGLKALGVALQIVVLPFQIFAKLLTALFGGGGKQLDPSQGAAFRQVSFTSSDQFAKSIYQAALKSSVAQPGAKDQVGWLQDISDVLKSIREWVKAIADKLRVEAPQDIANKGGTPTPLEGLRAGLGGPEALGQARARLEQGELGARGAEEYALSRQQARLQRDPRLAGLQKQVQSLPFGARSLGVDALQALIDKAIKDMAREVGQATKGDKGERGAGRAIDGFGGGGGEF